MNQTKRRKSLVFPESLRKRKASAKINLSAATRLLGKRLGSSSDLLNPAKIWMQTIPTQDCDVLFTFPSSTSDHTLMWILSCLRTRLPELEVYVRHHSSSGVHGYYLTTSYENLLKGAEDMRLRKKLHVEYGGGLKEFIFEERKCFEDVDDPAIFLSSQERQSIVLRLLNSLTAKEGDEVCDIKLVEGQAIIPKCLSEGIISQILPLHNEKTIEDLRENWVRAFFRSQPLNSICEYFGVKIAIYFAWLGHYTCALVIPAFLGLIIWLFCLGKDQATDDVCFVAFAFLNVLWATLYLVSWKRYCAALAYRWGTLDCEDELLVEPRPLFKGQLEISPVTGRLEPLYPAWKRNLFRYCVSFPVIGICLGVVVGSMFFMLEFQEWWDKMTIDMNYPFWFSYFPKILMAIVINILDVVYQKIALWLNDQENYRLEDTYENHLIIKLVLFQFLNSFLSLFYIAFYLQDMDKLREQLAALLITRQVIGNIRESFIPFLMEQFKLARMAHHKYGLNEESDGTNSDAKRDTDGEEMSENEENKMAKGMDDDDGQQQKINLSQAEVESSMYKYDGTFEDYLEMFIQFGYVILFSSAFPMAAMCALLNNIVEIRSDAFKLCCIFQRPFGQRAENIGSWQDAMEVMCIIAVMVNSALIGMSGQVHRMFPDLSTAGTIILIVILEHLTFTLKMILFHSIPSVPFWVASELAKIEYNRREASKKLIRTHSGTSLVLRSSPPIAKMTYSGGCNVGCQTDSLLGKNPAASNGDLQRTWSGKQSRKLSKFRLYDRLKRGRKRKGASALAAGLEQSSLSEPLHKLADSVGFFFDDDYDKGRYDDGSEGMDEESSNSSNYEVPMSEDANGQSTESGKNNFQKQEETMQEVESSQPPESKPSPSNTTGINTKRFSSPTFKLKSFRRFSTESSTSTETPPKTWNFGKLSFLRKSLTSKNLHKNNSKELVSDTNEDLKKD